MHPAGSVCTCIHCFSGNDAIVLQCRHAVIGSRAFMLDAEASPPDDGRDGANGTNTDANLGDGSAVAACTGNVEEEYLVPLLDMINHRRPRGTTYSQHHGVVRLLPLAGCSAGAQVWGSYGAKPSSHLLLKYGFALEPSDNTEPDGSSNDMVRIQVCGEDIALRVGPQRYAFPALSEAIGSLAAAAAPGGIGIGDGNESDINEAPPDATGLDDPTKDSCASPGTMDGSNGLDMFAMDATMHGDGGGGGGGMFGSDLEDEDEDEDADADAEATKRAEAASADAACSFVALLNDLLSHYIDPQQQQQQSSPTPSESSSSGDKNAKAVAARLVVKSERRV